MKKLVLISAFVLSYVAVPCYACDAELFERIGRKAIKSDTTASLDVEIASLRSIGNDANLSGYPERQQVKEKSWTCRMP